MMKKILCLCLTLLLVFSLAACGGNETTSNTTEGSTQTPPEQPSTQVPDTDDGYYAYGHDYENNPIDIGVPEHPLDPKTVYSNLTYTPQMFYGEYNLFGGDAAREKFGKEANYVTVTIGDEESILSNVPFAITAGPHTLSHILCYIEEYDWARVYYMKKSSDDGSAYLDYIMGAYSIEGNTFVFKPLSSFSLDEATDNITYEFSDVELRYDFSFCGRALTFTNGTDSSTMYSGLSAYRDYIMIHFSSYLSAGSKAIDKLDELTFNYSSEDNWSTFVVEYADWKEMPDGSRGGIARIEENGLFTFTIPWETGTKTYQYVYFLCDDDGVILTDGTNTYYYNDDYSDRNRNDLNKYTSEDQTGKLDELTEAELEAIVEKKDNLMEDLATAFNDAGIQVTVDQQSGELRMDSSVLFGGDSAVLTDEGKAFLNKFVGAYTSIVFSEKYDGFVQKTMVEGHTSPIAGATYEYGLPLSEERANNVKDYCVSSETGVDVAKLAESLEAIGYSNTRPVLDENGNVDQEASRRVSFKIIINLDF